MLREELISVNYKFFRIIKYLDVSFIGKDSPGVLIWSEQGGVPIARLLDRSSHL